LDDVGIGVNRRLNTIVARWVLLERFCTNSSLGQSGT
jgi:hypothetical protein